MRLTPTQVKTLRLLAEPGNEAYFMPHAGVYNPIAHWIDRHNNRRIRYDTMQSLKRRGLVEGQNEIVNITPAGREFLEGLK
jgi:hypothetical protein